MLPAFIMDKVVTGGIAEPNSWGQTAEERSAKTKYSTPRTI